MDSRKFEVLLNWLEIFCTCGHVLYYMKIPLIFLQYMVQVSELEIFIFNLTATTVP